MAQQIIDLLGRVFEETSRYRLYLEFPLYKNADYTYTRDKVTDNIFILIHKPKTDRYFMMAYQRHLGMYLLRELKYIGYEKSKDIRFEWANRKKNTKT